MKNLKIMSIMLALTACTLTFTACGDDDDYGEASTTAGVIKTDNGSVRVYQVGTCKFYYNDKGQLDYCTWGGDKIEFSYNPGKITSEDGDREFDAFYTSEGYLAKVSFSEKNGDKGTAEASYDSKGHLISITFNATEVENNYGKRVTYKGTETIKLTWKDDVITKIVEEEKWTGGGETEYDQDIYEYFYDQDIDNSYCQYTANFIYNFDTEFDMLGFVGLFGNGPKKLPTSMKETDDDGTVSNTRTFSYYFNSNGTLSYADGEYYYYNEVTSDNQSGKYKSPEKPIKKNGFFSRMHNR